ncbi:hypothetical protein CANMA_004042 [Candida margitis]|uniref:uncharacterized protein n=1 Tax=Candida margitis TaxID=1775924 RepID=UPI0022267810|nr:uncharacterized protein CANMA_004042 [Candida margitis]KAI5960262.1 hypothetical protein CANMA_004042 [Candida margitis]
MATIALNITYQGQPKKFTVNKSQTISQFISQCLTSYSIDANTFGAELYHNNKALDSASPIRLTNLLNNAKLTLKVKKLDSNKEINVKFISEKGTVVKKFTVATTLEDIVEQTVGRLQKPTQLRILDLVISYEKYTTATLGSIVGNANSVVIRLENQKSTNEKDALFRKQQEANRLQLAEAHKRKEVETQKKLQEEQERQRLEHERSKQVKQEPTEEPEEPEEDVEMREAAEDTPSTVTESESSPSTGEAQADGTGANFVYEEEKADETPKLYMPSNKPSPAYQNPEEDYNMTVDQAKTYQNVIRNSAKRVKKTDVKKPAKYFIRVKFPDGAMLQINFLENAHEVKFGSLVKKLDELLIPEFINSYNLKIGYPPFTKLNQSFALNNEKLHNLDEFKSEQVVLIWELSKESNKTHKGPFLNNESKDLVIKPSDELPAVKLEKHRSELPAGEKKTGLFKSKPKSKDGEDKDDKKKSKLPRWLKMKK